VTDVLSRRAPNVDNRMDLDSYHAFDIFTRCLSYSNVCKVGLM
jgi:hypothetical protein